MKRKYSLDIDDDSVDDDDDFDRRRKLLVSTKAAFSKKNYFLEQESLEEVKKLDPIEEEWNKCLQKANKSNGLGDTSNGDTSNEKANNKSRRSRGHYKKDITIDGDEENELYNYLKKAEPLGSKPIHLFWFITGSFNMGKMTVGSDFAVIRCKAHYFNKLIR